MCLNCTKDNYYKYEFGRHCYEEYPLNSTERKNSTELDFFSLDKQYFCKPIFSEATSFEIKYAQECMKNCPVKNIIDKSCILKYLIVKIEKKEEEENKEETVEKKDEKEERTKEQINDKKC